MSEHSFLSIQGNQIVDGQGRPVVLRGFGLGGWMNMENFITGYPASESAQRQVLLQALGSEKYEFFFDRFLEYFFGEDDARFIQSLGLNLVRIPINYRHFEDDDRPFEIKERGFKHLDRVIEACARHNLYTIIDLHAVQGWQNQDWHSDNPTHKALFWEHRHFQDRAVHLWGVLAGHYKDNAWVAGYNPLNEPYDPSEERIEGVYRRLVAAIRAVDPNHLIYFEGNRYSQDFHIFGEALPGVVYANHLYAAPGFRGDYPGMVDGIYYDNEVLEEEFLRKSKFMLEHGTPIWVGEFGPIYSGDARTDARRDRVLRDQLEIFNHHRASWSIWTYKDIGLQGTVYVAPNSPWMALIKPVLEKKTRLGLDGWGGEETHIRHIMAPLEETFASEFPHYNPGPFGVMWQARRLVRHILLSEALLPEFGALFAGLAEADLEPLLQSFAFRNCTIRESLAGTLAAYAQ